MKSTTQEISDLKKNWPLVVVWVGILLYIGYLTFFTIVRYRYIYASYFDLGIMNQTVYNTYKALVTFDFSQFLEMTSPFGPEQIKRMAIHNDVFLALLAPFYLLKPGPETLLAIQSIVVGLGALGIYGIAAHAFVKYQHQKVIAMIFALAYLLYPVLAKANIFEFHSVTLATTFLIFMFYFWLKRRFGWSFFFLVLALTTKEQVGLTTFFFGGYALLCHTTILPRSIKHIKRIVTELRKDTPNLLFSLAVMAMSLIWFLLSILVIIPYFRGSEHFALKYYDEGVTSFTNFFHEKTFWYLVFLFSPLGFLSFFAPLKLLIALPEFAINLFSSNLNMRNVLYHYTAVITPFIIISAIYGLRNAAKLIKVRDSLLLLLLYMCITVAFCSVWIGPLPFSSQADTYAFRHKRPEQKYIDMWAERLKDDRIRVSASSQIAPAFTSRRYFYNFGKNYPLADYVVIRLPEVYNYPERDGLVPIYEQLMVDPQFVKIYDQANVVVYKKI